MTELTGYAAAKIANEIFAEAGIKQIPPQMVYNYISKKMIPSTPVIENGKTVKKVALSDLQAWISKYAAKKGIEISFEVEEELSEAEIAERELDEKILEEAGIEN